MGAWPWNLLADAFVALMQALSLAALCAGAAFSIREGFRKSGNRRGSREAPRESELPAAGGDFLDRRLQG